MNDRQRTSPSSAHDLAVDHAASARPAGFGTLAATLSLLLAMIGGAGAAEEPRAPVPVTVTAKGCEPMELTVPAGTTTFVITNRSSRALEWEILDGVVVVDERENIAPGFKSRLTTKLKPGTYEVTCGLLDNPRGRLVVTGAVASGAAARPAAADLIGVVAEYRVGNHATLSSLADAIARLPGADAATATGALIEARTAFLATAPIHGLAGAASEALARDLAAAEAEVFADPARPLGDLAGKLATDARAFAAAIGPIVASADKLLAGSLATATALVADAEAASPAPDALAAIEARRAAIERVVQLLAGHTRAVGPEAAAALDAALAGLRTELARSPGPIGGFADARRLPAEQRTALVAAARTLADRLAPLPGLLGL